MPDLECDIIMKGGISSGVVYPGAVLSLSRRYRFRSIGGTSAGGIAAALTAAAEHARDRGGFEKLATLPDTLAGTTADGRPFMLQLFQPDPPTRPFFGAVIGGLEHGAGGALLALVNGFWRFPVLAALLGVASILVTATTGASAGWAVAGVLVALVVLATGLAADVAGAASRLPANDFGLCRLGPDAGTDAAPALTGWLHQRIQDTAGRATGGPLLTFADLWAGSGVALPDDPEARRERVVALSRDPEARATDLQMMTTDLSHGLPLRLPVPYQQHKAILEGGGGLLFSPEELRRFFSAGVVEHLERHGEPLSDETAQTLRRLGRPELRHFPIGPDLPVVVATRMTLSFPVLISAVPLYELEFRPGAAVSLVRVLFSDGGITSNFPVHFFDAPLPTRPTFGLNLAAFDGDADPDPGDPCAAVRTPGPVNTAARPSVARIEGLAAFVTAIKDAMQNWRDTAQAQLPGYRERVVDIKLGEGEGGLNLTMKPDKIRELDARGTCAGDALVRLFAGDGTGPPPQWNDHRFVRYRTTMAQLERFLRAYARGYRHPVDAVTVPYPERVAAGTVAPYPFTAAALAFAQETTTAYLGLLDAWEHDGTTLDGPGVPRPPATLRSVPPV